MTTATLTPTPKAKPPRKQPIPRWLVSAPADPRISSSTRHLALLGGLIASWDGDPSALARRVWDLVVEGVPAYSPPPLRKATPSASPTPTPSSMRTAKATEAGPRSRSKSAMK
ncbi:hypothetical protein [Limnoglobus roseus]|nr:hypothetical protein [Limnoglobus roseus]